MMMTYLLQVSTCWIGFYTIYMIFLQKETFFSINRYYLLGALFAGLAIPYLGGLLPANHTSTEIYQVMNQATAIEITAGIKEEKSIFSWINFMYFIYSIGATIVFVRFLYGLSRIFSIYKNAKKTRYESYTLVESSKYHLPFSFFRFIFISKKLPLNKDVEKVLKHEELHASQWHSLDIVILELLQVLFWFNPILIFYKKALKQSHEFLADAYVTMDHNKNSYGQLLLRQSTSGLEIALANHFFHSQIKKRITMLYKEKSKRPAMVKYLVAIPVLAAMLFIFSSSQMEDHSQNNFGDDCFVLKIEDHNAYSTNGVPITLLEIEEKINNKNLKCIDLNYNHSTFISSAQPITKMANKASLDIRLNEGTQILTSVFGEELKKEPDYRYNSKDQNFKLIEASKNLFGLKSDVFKGQKPNNDQGDPIFIVVEEMPRFPGCGNMEGSVAEKKECAKGKMLEFIYAQLKYPEEAIKNNIQGMTVIQFVVNKDGSISGGKIVRDIGGDAGAESLRVVNSMPTWIPGKQKGEPVNVQYKLPIKFKLDGNKASAEEKSQKEGLPSSTKEKEKNINVVAFGKKSDEAIKNNLAISQQNLPLEHNDKEEIFRVVEEMPRFPGCENDNLTLKEKKECSKLKMLEFIYTNIKYPQEARSKGIEGVAVVQLIIEKDGSVSSSIIMRNPGAGTGEEAKRIIDKMPNWIPGKQSGKTVRVQYILPIKYKLEGDKVESKEENLNLNNVETKEKLNASAKTQEQNTSIELFQNVPNPFKERTEIEFKLSEAAPVTMTVFNVANKVISKKNIDGLKGSNIVNYTASELGTRGVLYYTLESGKFRKTRKMIVYENK